MNETLKMMKSVLDKDLSNLSNEQLVSMYKKTGYDSIIAQIFVDNYPLFWKQYQKSRGFIDADEAASLSLMIISRCLDSYKEDSGVKFTTFLFNALHNAYGSELTKKNRAMRKCEEVSLNNIREDDIEYQDLFGEEDSGYSLVEINMVIDSSHLNDKSKKICKFYINGYSQVAIASMMNVSSPMVHQTLKKLRTIHV